MDLGRTYYDGSPDDGVFIEASDVEGGWQALRDAILDTRSAADVMPHVTLVHPRTTNRGRAAWDALQEVQLHGEMVITDVAATAFDGRRWLVPARMRLSCRGPRHGPD
jgi:hypothetical protein